MKPLISVVIPAKNEAADLPTAIASIAAQDYPLERIEVSVVDGDSTDGTAEVAEELLRALSLHRFAVLANPNGNTPSNLNRGLAWSRGEFIVRVDARSQIPSDYLRRTTAILADRSQVVVTGGSQVAIPRTGNLRDQAIVAALNNPWAMGGSRYRRQAASGPSDTVYLGVFRRAQLSEVNGWNEQFSTNQDFELNRRIAALGIVWFEAGLPVGYLPRRSAAALFRQYHRFGRWKAHYWVSSGRRPERRQWILLVAPPVVLTLAGLALPKLFRRSRAIRWGSPAVVAFVASRQGLVGVLGWTINAVVATGWWTGVVRGFTKDDVR